MTQTSDGQHVDAERTRASSAAPYPAMAPYQYPAPAAPQTTSTMAVVALMMSLLWIGGLGSLIGVILGNIAASDCKRTGQPGGGIATAAVILGALGSVLTLFVIVA